MSRKYKENYALIDFSKDIVVERKERPLPPRSDLPCPQVMSDVMEPTQSMLDGKMYASKSALRATYRAAGVTEVGNDPARLKPFKKPKASEKTIREVVDKAAARFNRGERAYG